MCAYKNIKPGSLFTDCQDRRLTVNTGRVHVISGPWGLDYKIPDLSGNQSQKEPVPIGLLTLTSVMSIRLHKLMTG